MASFPANTGPSPGESRVVREPGVEYSREEPSIAELLGGLVGDAQTLVRKEIDLAKEEARQELDKAKQGAISIGIGAAIAAAGGILLSHMLALLLQALLPIPLWASYLIVGALLAIIGGVLAWQGANRMKEVDPVPRETVDSVRKDVEWLKEQNPSDKI